MVSAPKKTPATAEGGGRQAETDAPGVSGTMGRLWSKGTDETMRNDMAVRLAFGAFNGIFCVQVRHISSLVACK